MTKGLLALNIVLLLAVGILYLLFFTKKDKAGDTITSRPAIDTASGWLHTPIAYFEIDSVEENFLLARQMRDEVAKNEEQLEDSITRLRTAFQLEGQKFREERSKLTPDEVSKAETYFYERDQLIKSIEKGLNAEHEKYYMTMKQSIVTQIKNYCKQFNKDRKYAYIIAKEPGFFYYTDEAYNITAELVKGLNEYYSKKKKN